ncbi:MAG: 2-oxoglutarate dehydrogenase E1 component [Thermoguttaceae bacterium]
MAEGRVAPLNLEYLEHLYGEYIRHPSRVPLEWRNYFAQAGNGDGRETPVTAAPPRMPVSPPPIDSGVARAAVDPQVAERQECIDLLIREYRVRGHFAARTDPLGTPRPSPRELDPSFYGLVEADLERSFSTCGVQGSSVQTLRTILQRLRNTYCGFIGAQFMHIQDMSAREWLQQRMEGTENRLKLTRDIQLRILTRLTDAVIFEEFVRRKFVGAKSFSLEGAESLVPLLDLAIEKAGNQDVQDIVLGMAHRGRLNVLANIIGKSPREIFREFEDTDADKDRGRGDVKYHLGYRNTWTTASDRKIGLTLCFNPSHLEFVDPVVLGLTRAKQDRLADSSRETAMAILIHGDAAFAGEGIVQETLNLSQLDAYTTGGTLHIIINNQLGFTTPPSEGRSTAYASDVAKMLDVPIFHVNGEHPEAVAQAVDLAMDFRRAFRRDVLIDMYCYRRWGHNEGDEPSFTQPLMYHAIGHRKSVRHGYLEHLFTLGEIGQEEADEIARRRRENLEQELSRARQPDFVRTPVVLGDLWRGYRGGPEPSPDGVRTGVDRPRLAALLERLATVPRGFHLHRKLERWLESRRAMARGEQPLDWSTAEALAFASLAAEGYRIRLTGQDTPRGTFSQRHAVLHDTEDGHVVMPLRHVASDQAPVEVFNSPLSEAAVLGFEYGYSLGYPDGLVLWEAQFGDFVNAAQVIIDQFLASAEEKWQHLSGLVLLLPHGHEGQGPEHSSARLERFLQLAAADNLQIVAPTNPAQYFHCLRRQAIRRWQKPLVLLTPKSLLRHPRHVSPLEDLADGRFERVLSDKNTSEIGSPVDRVLMCAGKIYYELREALDQAKRGRVALLRLEQLYPLPHADLESAVRQFPDGTPAYWVQEEPENMGAWHYIKHCFGERLFDRLPLASISRPASGSPAGGSAGSHRLEQQELVSRAVGNY